MHYGRRRVEGSRQGSAKFGDAWGQSQVWFNRVPLPDEVPVRFPEKVETEALGSDPGQVNRVQEKVAEKVAEALVQSHVRCHRFLEKVPGKAWSGSKGFREQGFVQSLGSTACRTS